MPECKCLPFTETFARAMHGEDVPACPLHGTFGAPAQQSDKGTGGDPPALNSEALEQRLADTLGAAVDSHRTDYTL